MVIFRAPVQLMFPGTPSWLSARQWLPLDFNRLTMQTMCLCCRRPWKILDTDFFTSNLRPRPLPSASSQLSPTGWWNLGYPACSLPFSLCVRVKILRPQFLRVEGAWIWGMSIFWIALLRRLWSMAFSLLPMFWDTVVDFGDDESGQDVFDQARVYCYAISKWFLIYSCCPFSVRSALLLGRVLLDYNIIHKGAKAILSIIRSSERFHLLRASSLMNMGTAILRIRRCRPATSGVFEGLCRQVEHELLITD